MPYPAAENAAILKQNTGQQAAILNIARRAREHYGDSMTAVMNHQAVWKGIVRESSALSFE
jgi:hypothetical protein